MAKQVEGVPDWEDVPNRYIYIVLPFKDKTYNAGREEMVADPLILHETIDSLVISISNNVYGSQYVALTGSTIESKYVITKGASGQLSGRLSIRLPTLIEENGFKRLILREISKSIWIREKVYVDCILSTKMDERFFDFHPTRL